MNSQKKETNIILYSIKFSFFYEILTSKAHSKLEEPANKIKI